MTLINKRAPLLSNIKLCSSFHHHIWIQTGVTVRKWLSWVLTSVSLTFDLWPWPFAWTSLLSLVISPDNFMMIRWWEHSQTRQIWGIWKLRPAYSPETPNLGQNRWCFVPCDLEIWWMTLENNRAPLLCCFQLCAWFHCHVWIQTGVRVRKRLSWVLTSVTLTFDLWPWPFAWTSLLTMVITPDNFMMIRWWEHGEKGVTDGQRQTRQIWGIWKLRPAYSPETPNLGQNRWCFVPCDLEIWWMTLENNRAPLLCCFKLCAKFHSHRWIQTGVAVRKRPIWVKFDDF